MCNAPPANSGSNDSLAPLASRPNSRAKPALRHRSVLSGEYSGCAAAACTPIAAHKSCHGGSAWHSFARHWCSLTHVPTRPLRTTTFDCASAAHCFAPPAAIRILSCHARLKVVAGVRKHAEIFRRLIHELVSSTACWECVYAHSSLWTSVCLPGGTRCADCVVVFVALAMKSGSKSRHIARSCATNCHGASLTCSVMC